MATTTVKFIAMLIIGLVVGLGIGYVIAIPKGTQEVKISEYVIGMPADLSGPGADYGIEVRDAGLLTVEEINEFLKKNNIPIRFKLEVEDSKTTVEGAVQAVQSLAGKGVKVIVGHLWSGQLGGVKSYVDSHKILTISVSSTSPTLSVKDYIFRVQAPDSVQGKVLAKLIWELGYRKVAVVYRNDPYGSGVFKYFNDAFKNLGGTVKSLAYTPDQPDYSSEVLKLSSMVKDLGADSKTAVLIVAFNYEAIKLFDKARHDKILSSVRWFSSESLKGPGFLPPASPPEIGDFAVKVNLTGTYPATLTVTELMKEFSKKFKARYGREPKGYGAYTYDALWLVALSIITAGTDDGETLLKVLPVIAERFTGATGPLVFDENGDRALQDYQIWQVIKTDKGYDFRIIGGYSGASGELKLFY